MLCFKLYEHLQQNEHHKNVINNNRSKTLYKISKTLATITKENILPSSFSNKEIADSFANFFVEKNQQNEIRI